MSGPADPLQTAGHRRRRLDLDDEIDCAHVDPEFQARGRHDGFESSGLEFVLNLGALLFRHRPVVGTGQWLAEFVGTFGADLVDPGRQLLGQPP